MSAVIPRGRVGFAKATKTTVGSKTFGRHTSTRLARRHGGPAGRDGRVPVVAEGEARGCLTVGGGTARSGELAEVADEEDCEDGEEKGGEENGDATQGTKGRRSGPGTARVAGSEGDCQ